MTYNTIIPGLTHVRGTHYARGADYLYFVRGSGSTSAGIYRIPLNPATLVSEGHDVAFAVNKQLNLNGQGGNDLLRASGTHIQARSGARVEPLTAPSFAAILPNDLLAVAWGTSGNNLESEDGQSSTGRLYGVRIPTKDGVNYAKVRVYKNAAGSTRIDWTTYLLNPDPIRVSPSYGDVRDIVVSDYESEIYLSGVDGSGRGYVGRVERTVGGSYPEYSLSSTSINATELVEPQQIVLDSTVVYVVDNDSVWRFDELNATEDKLVDGLQGGVGLLLDRSSAGIRAFIADAEGLHVVNLADYAGTTLSVPPAFHATSGPSGFLTWANEEHTAIYFTDRATKQVRLLDLDSNEEIGVQAASTEPWSIEVTSSGALYVASEEEIGSVLFTIAPSGALVLGIGLIPFEYIINSINFTLPPALDDGKVDTSSANGYFFSQYPKLPLGGNLSLMLNHNAAWNSAIRYYKISLQNADNPSGAGRSITKEYTDMRWNPASSPPRFEPVSTATESGLYPVRSPADLWYNSHLASVISTSVADNGHKILKVEFFNDKRQPVGVPFERLLLIDNTRYSGRLDLPRIGAPPPAPPAPTTLQCGCLTFTTKNDLVEVDFAAWHPQGAGEYALSFYRGSTHLATLAQRGPLTTTQTLTTKNEVSPGTPLRVGHLIGDCDVANITITLGVPSRVIDGFGWVSLSASQSRSFTLLKAPLTHTPWPP
jgi:hypothetical protein